jgi:hypothetical protein
MTYINAKSKTHVLVAAQSTYLLRSFGLLIPMPENACTNTDGGAGRYLIASGG